MTYETSGLWERSDLEDIIARVTIGLWEKFDKLNNRLEKIARLSPSLINKIKEKGIYVPPSDRIVYAHNELDVTVDGLPTFATAATFIDYKITSAETARGVIPSYVQIYALKRIDRLPQGCFVRGVNSRNLPAYCLTSLAPNHEHGLSGANFYLVIHNNMMLEASYMSDEYNPVTKRRHKRMIHPSLLDANIRTAEEIVTLEGLGWHSAIEIQAALTYQVYSDRTNLWNVRATDSETNTVFGVYEQQIQSLFYARELPTTQSGRKRPILHWVKAHQRRMKEGCEIDIEQHLRGIRSFEMNGTRFEIIRPQQ